MHYEHFTHPLLWSACCLGALDFVSGSFMRRPAFYNEKRFLLPGYTPGDVSSFSSSTLVFARHHARRLRPTSLGRRKSCWLCSHIDGVHEGCLPFSQALVYS
jgi:hypothetical protein